MNGLIVCLAAGVLLSIPPCVAIDRQRRRRAQPQQTRAAADRERREAERRALAAAEAAYLAEVHADQRREYDRLEQRLAEAGSDKERERLEAQIRKLGERQRRTDYQRQRAQIKAAGG